ncbi:MAG: response regulator [Undibacterium sp.]|nr:response regulator [Undibacterium sp.]
MSKMIRHLDLHIALAGLFFFQIQVSSAQSQPLPYNYINIKTIIEADNRNNPLLSLKLEEETLSLLGTNGDKKERISLLAFLSRDALSLRQFTKALTAAREGQALISEHGAAVDRVHFSVLVAWIFMENEPKQADAEMQLIAPLLSELALSENHELRMEAALAFRTLGMIKKKVNRVSDSMQALIKALQLYEGLDDVRGQGLTHSAIGDNHFRAGRYAEAEAEIIKALKITAAYKDDGLSALLHVDLAGIYANMGRVNQQIKELEITQVFAEKAQRTDIRLNAMVDLADVSLKLKNYPMALRRANEAITLAKKVDDRTSLFISTVNKGVALNRLKRDGGIPLIKQALDYFTSVDNQVVVEITGVLADEYAFNGDFEKAYQTQQSFKNLSDNLTRQADQKRITEMLAGYQSEKQQSEIDTLHKDRLTQARFRNLWILAGLLGFFIALILIFGRKRLRESNNELTRFLAVAGHDLRQPMHALDLYLGALANMVLPEKARAILENATQCAMTMDTMFMALLDLSRLEARTVQVQIKHFPLAEILSGIENEFTPQAQEKGIAFHVEPSTAWVSSDSILVSQILRNLTVNAIRYTDTGRVSILCEAHGSSMRISVSDTGIGIEPRLQKTIFDEFNQGNVTALRRAHGMGLGLAIVKRVARLLTATLSVVSVPNRGSTFTLELPSAPIRTRITKNDELPAGKTDIISGKLVVFIDDEDSIRQAMNILLEQWGCIVVLAKTTKEAIEQLVNSLQEPYVLICDYALNGDDNGVEAIRELRDMFNREIPAMLVTGNTLTKNFLDEISVDLPILYKPIQADSLRAALTCLLNAANDDYG